jgi:hypothetical protein
MTTKTLLLTYDQKYELLHQDMLRDMNFQMQQGLPEAKMVESCFWIGIDYWERLKKMTAGFRNEIAEINFFRNIKPQFTSHIEYFAILCEALLFIPPEQSEFISYWEEEAKRCYRFYNRHNNFILYYESGNHSMDNIYFLRSTGPGYSPKAAIYDQDSRFRTSYDPLLRSYLAHKKFEEYVIKKLVGVKSS